MLTTAQLISLALQTSRKTGSQGSGFSPQAGQQLNLILNELNLLYDLPISTAAATVVLTGVPSGPAGWVGEMPGIGPYALPANYLRMAQDEVVYNFNGAPQKMINVDLSEIDFSGLLQLNSNYPTLFATDINTAITTGTPSIYVWPPPQGAITVNFRYQSLQPDIATPETSGVMPWMQLETYLLARLTAEMFEPDPRADRFYAKAEKLLQTYLSGVDDNEGRAMTIHLDPRNFTGAYNRLPRTKLVDF